MTENILNTSRYTCTCTAVLDKVVPPFIRNSEVSGDIVLEKWPKMTLSFITDTA